jgi:hypothetical protein
MWGRWLCVAVTAGLIIGIIVGAEIFSLASEGYPQRQPHFHNQYQPIYASLVQIISGWWARFRVWFDHDAITTIAIATTAIFTGTLWAATKRLGYYASTQAGDMQSLLQAARDNANAAIGFRAAAEAQAHAMQEQAKSMTAVAEAAGKSADIGRRALTELERPLIMVEVPDPGILVNDVGNFSFSQTKARWEVANYGRSPAILIDRILRWTAETDPLPYAINANVAKGMPFPDGCIVVDNKTLVEYHDYYLELDKYNEVYGHLAAGKYRIWCFGYVRYRDTIGGIYVNGFCLVFDPTGKRFVRMGPPSHNYTHVEKEPGT